MPAKLPVAVRGKERQFKTISSRKGTEKTMAVAMKTAVSLEVTYSFRPRRATSMVSAPIPRSAASARPAGQPTRRGRSWMRSRAASALSDVRS